MRARLAVLVTLTLLLAASRGHAQLCGRVVDVQTDAGIRGVRVVVQSAHTRRETFTDVTGAYDFADLPPGEYAVYATHLAYEYANLRVLLVSARAITVDIPLKPQPFVLAPVVVSVVSADAGRALDEMHSDTLPLDEYFPALYRSRLPAGLGDLTGAQLSGQTPNPGGGAAHTLHILGSGGERGVVLIDGIALGAPLHLGGILPQLSGAMVESAALQMGGAAARYDGGTSYILEYRTKAPRAQQFGMRGDASMLAIDVSAAAPIGHRASVHTAVRSVNHGLLEALTPARFGYEYDDALTSLNWRSGGRSSVRALFFRTSEGLRIPRDLGFDDVGWSNHAAGLAWTADTLDSGLAISGSFSRGRARLPLLSAPEGRLTATLDRTAASVTDEWQLHAAQLRAGLQYEHVRIARASRAGQLSCAPLLPCSAVTSTTVSAFGDLTTALGKAANLHLGLRANVARGQLDLLPRFSLAHARGSNTVASISLGRFSQLSLDQPRPDQLHTRRQHAEQLELKVKHSTNVVTIGGSGRMLRLENDNGGHSILPAGEISVAAIVGPARLAAGFSALQRELAMRDSLYRRVQRQLFFGVTTEAGAVHVDASVVHGSNLPLTSIVLDGVTPPAPEPYFPPPRLPGESSRPHTRVDFGLRGLWTMRLGDRIVRLAPYARLINAFNSDALFYYQPSGSTDLHPVSALPTMPVLGVQWTF